MQKLKYYVKIKLNEPKIAITHSSGEARYETYYRNIQTTDANSNTANVILRDRMDGSSQATVSGSSTTFYADDAADYLTVQVYQNSGAALNIVGNNDDSTVVSITRVDVATQGTNASGASGRVQFSDGSGGFNSDSDLTFVTDTLTATKIGAFEAAGAIDFSDEAMTNVNIDSGDIASGVTINKSPTVTLTGDVTASATAMTNLGNVSLATTIAANSVALSTDTTGNYVATVTGGTGITSTGATTGEGIAHSLSVDASQTQITAVGDLDAGSITSGFTSIDVGSGTITTTGSLQVRTIDYSDGDLAMTIADGGGVTFAQAVDLGSNTLTTTGSLQVRTIDYSDGDNAMTIADGGAVTFAQAVDLGSNTLTSTGSMQIRTIDYSDGDNAVTIADGGGVTFAQDISTTDAKYIKLGGSRMATAEPASDSTGYGIVIGFDSAGSISAGDAVYINSSGKVAQANANAGSVTDPAIGIATNAAGSDGDDCYVLTHGIWRLDAEAFQAGDPVYVGESAGALTKDIPNDDGDYVQRIGVAVSDDVIFVMPSLDVIEHA